MLCYLAGKFCKMEQHAKSGRTKRMNQTYGVYPVVSME